MLGRPAGRVSVCGKHFNVAIFTDTINTMNVKVCVMVVLTELYLFILLSVTLIVYQGNSSVKRFRLKILCSYRIMLKLCRVVDYVK